MIYLSDPAVKAQILDDMKIIIMTNEKLLFTHADFIEEFITIPLVTCHPRDFYHHHDSMQTLVQSESTLEIYYCDWKTQVKLLRVIILNLEKIDQIYYEPSSGWNIYGEHVQYEKARVTFHEPISKNNNSIAHYSVGQNFYQFFKDKINKTSLSGKDKKSHSIHWKDMENMIQIFDDEVQIKGDKISENQDIICIDNYYLMIIGNNQILRSFSFNNINYFNKQLVIYQNSNSSDMLVNQIEHTELIEIGKLPAMIGVVMEIKKTENQLIMLQYYEKQITIMNIYLESASEIENDKDKKPQKVLPLNKGSQKEQVSEDLQNNKNERRKNLNSNQKVSVSKRGIAYKKEEIETNSMQNIIPYHNQSSITNQAPKQQELLISHRVQCFRDPKIPLTPEIIAEIQQTKLTKLLREKYEKNPEQYTSLLNQFLPQIMEDQETPFLLADTLRTHNPQFTSQKIRLSINSYLGSQIYKEKLTFTFQQFLITEVPEQILNFDKGFIKIIKIIYKEAYIGDLLNATDSVFYEIISSYFNIDVFKEQIIVIEDEEINITYPRNLLNILLFLNETFQRSIETIFKIYCDSLLKNNQLNVIKQLLGENVFSICGVDKTILDELLIVRFNELIENFENVGFVSQIVTLMTDDMQQPYKMKLGVVKQLNKNNINCDLSEILKMNNHYFNIEQFFDRLIQQNEIQGLLELRTDVIYLAIFCIKYGEKLTNVNDQFIEIQKMLAEKCFETNRFQQGFNILTPIISRIKAVFIAKLLYCYNDCKFLNRLAEANIHHENSLQEIFPEYFNSEIFANKQIPRDQISPPNYSDWISCTWGQFSQIFNRYLKLPAQVKFLAYKSLKLSCQLFDVLSPDLQKPFQQFYAKIQNQLLMVPSEVQENQESEEFIIEFKDLYKKIIHSNQSQDQYSMQELLYESNQPKVFKSLTAIQHYDPYESSQKAKSDFKASDSFLKNNTQFKRLKLLVSQQQIYETLREIYERESMEYFLKCLKYIDIERVKIYYLQKLKQLHQNMPDFHIQSIVLFDVLLSQNTAHNYKLIKPKIEQLIQSSNFWEIYMIAEKILGNETEIAKIMIRKIIEQEKNDDQAHFINDIILSTNLLTNSSYIRMLREKAKKFNLNKTAQMLLF